MAKKIKAPTDDVWTKKEIEKAAKIIAKAKEKKSKGIAILDSMVYWLALAIAVIGNIIISITLIPILLALKTAFLYVIIITIGISFGLLFEIIIRDIENLEAKHHLIISFIIPLIAIANLIIITNYASKLEAILRLSNPHANILVAIAYTIAFISPYVFYQFIRKK